MDESNRLFDFSSCECVNFANWNCAKKKQVPQIEQSLLSDQRDPQGSFVCFNWREKAGGFENRKRRKGYLNYLAKPKLSNSTTVETIRENTDKSPLQPNVNDGGENTAASDDY